MSKWTQADIPNLDSKIVIMTGANSGLGFESTKALAAKGAMVIMAVRTLSKGEAARDDILAETPNAKLDVMRLDVGDLSSVKAFADEFKAKYNQLHILCNNAGVMAIPRQETVDGFEMQLGVNHLGHFALTHHLMEVILNTPHARIHNVTSSANWTGTIHFDDLMLENDYGRWESYGQSKLANVFFTFELHNRLRDAGYNDVIVNTSHPGLVLTNLQTKSVEQSGTNMEAFLYRVMEPIMAQDIEMGILPMLYGMTAKEATSGVFYGPRWFNLRGYPKQADPNDEAKDADKLRRFWEMSVELTGVDYPMLRKEAVIA